MHSNYYNGGKITVEKADDGSDYFDPHGMHIAGILREMILKKTQELLTE